MGVSLHQGLCTMCSSYAQHHAGCESHNSGKHTHCVVAIVDREEIMTNWEKQMILWKQPEGQF